MTGIHEPLDRYSRAAQTALHRAPAVVKLLIALAMIAAFSFTPATFLPGPTGFSMSLVHVFGGLLLVVALVWAGIPVGYVVSRILAIAPLVVAISLSVPLGRHFDAESWMLMAQLIARGLLSFVTVLVLVNTTPIEKLLRAMRQLGVPALLVSIFGLMVRYQTVVLDELGRMRRARLSRTFDRRGIERWGTVAGLVGRALVRAYERSERVHAAMLARGYDGGDRSTIS
jgi:cobalt/nickel transport system permease protein